jgi:hypothetical protein
MELLLFLITLGGKFYCLGQVRISFMFFIRYTGRVRNVCDYFGDNNMFAVIPNFGSHGKN